MWSLLSQLLLSQALAAKAVLFCPDAFLLNNPSPSLNECSTTSSPLHPSTKGFSADDYENFYFQYQGQKFVSPYAHISLTANGFIILDGESIDGEDIQLIIGERTDFGYRLFRNIKIRSVGNTAKRSLQMVIQD